jgi:hypothetical protein
VAELLVSAGSAGSPDVTEVFEREAVRYDAWFDSPEGRALLPSEVEAVSMLLKDLPRPVLEVGVGTDRFAEALRVPYGIDPALGVLRLARRRGIRVVQARGEVPAVSRPDLRWCVDDHDAVLFESPSAPTGGTAGAETGRGVVIADILRDSAWGRWYLEKKLAGHPFYRHATFYTNQELQGFLTEVGFVLAEVASAVTQVPGGPLYAEPAYKGLEPKASFVCLLGRRA